MSSPAPATPRGHRLWIPLVLLTISAIALMFIWSLPSDELELGAQIFLTLFIVVPVLLLLGIWWFFFSRVRWRWRLLSILGTITLIFGVSSQIERVELTADNVPMLEFKWGQRREAALVAHRRAMAERLADTVVDLKIPLDEVAASDVAEFRGPRRDGVVTGPPLSQDWAGHLPRQVWRQPVGAGCAGIILVGNALITAEQRGANEAVVCYDKLTGREVWSYGYPALIDSTGGAGPRATPTFARGRVYALGSTGKLVCLNANNGQMLWSTEVLDETQDKTIDHGLASSPLVCDQMVIVTPGMQSRRDRNRGVLSYDCETGQLVWGAAARPGSYASPMLVELAGRRQILVFDGAGLVGYDPATGTPLWDFPFADINKSEFNIVQPLVLSGDRIFVCSGAGAALVHILAISSGEQLTAESVWSGPEPGCTISNPVVDHDTFYGLCRGILTCVDLNTGKRLWKRGRYRHGQLLRYDQQLIIQGEGGDLALVAADPLAFREVTRFHALDGDKTWNFPALSEGFIYLRNHREMACYDLRVGGQPAPAAQAITVGR